MAPGEVSGLICACLPKRLVPINLFGLQKATSFTGNMEQLFTEREIPKVGEGYQVFLPFTPMSLWRVVHKIN